MNRQQQVFVRLKLKAKALGFNAKELKGIAAKIADNLKSAEDASEEDVNAEIDEQIEAVLPYLTFGQSQANRLLDEWKKKHPESEEDDDDKKLILKKKKAKKKMKKMMMTTLTMTRQKAALVQLVQTRKIPTTKEMNKTKNPHGLSLSESNRKPVLQHWKVKKFLTCVKPNLKPC